MKKYIFLAAIAAISLFSSCIKKEIVYKYLEPESKVDTLYGLTDGSYVQIVSIQEFDVKPENSASENAENLQDAINWASKNGAALYVTPTDKGYPVSGGIVLKKNVALIGAQGPTGRGTANASKNGPAGSFFKITDTSKPFITVESATMIKGIQFYYPNQTYTDGSKIIAYPPTIKMSDTNAVQGVTLANLTFYGEYVAMDFTSPSNISEQILFENCYGYPLSGEFIKIDKCYDIPRVLHCHVNPANQREFGRGYNKSIIDAVVNKKTYTYWFDHIDNLVLMDIFTFGAYGGIYIGKDTYGQLTSFNFDCVNRGIYRTGTSAQNRNWFISQGSIIANTGATTIADIHPVIIDGSGYTSLVGVEAFSGNNAALTNLGKSYDFLYVTGTGYPSVALTNCRMNSYTSSSPITVGNRNAYVKCVSCVDMNGNFFEYETAGTGDIVSGTSTVFDSCESTTGWSTDFSGGVKVDNANKVEGSGSLSVTGKGTVVFSCKKSVPVDTRTDMRGGYVKFSIYISDITALDATKDASIEFTSSGTCDKNEVAWQFKSIGLRSGWNNYDLPLSSGGITGGDPDLRAINFARLYYTGITSNLTIKIDNIEFYQK